jgi:hypothetical protein
MGALDAHAQPLALATLVTASRWMARAPVADDTDAINFLSGMSSTYDLAALSPHFPGYPVYIALGRVFVALGLDALCAATLIASIASGATAFALFVCGRHLSNERAGAAAVLFHAAAWLPWLLGSGAGSDSLGVALIAASFAALTMEENGAVAGGVLGGLTLGVRASYWPLCLSAIAFAYRRRRAQRFGLGFAAGIAAWAIPLFAVVGVRRLIEVGTEHLDGHFHGWGGTIVTAPNLIERSFAFARALVFDGFAPTLLAVLSIFALMMIFRPGSSLKPSAIIVFAALAPYAVWVFLAQNIVEQPRHALPLVEGALLMLGCWFAERPVAIAAVALLMATAAIPLVVERRRVPPSAAQAVAWIEETYPNTARSEVAVMAGRSARFFQALPERFPVRQRTTLAEVIVDLGRFDRLPSTTIITSEIDVASVRSPRSRLPDHWHLEDGPTFCRDVRIDRATPCLSLKKLAWSPR